MKWFKAIAFSTLGFLFASLSLTANAGIKNLSSKITAPGEPVFVFSPKLKRWAFYDSSGDRVAHGPANGGAGWCKDVGRSCRTPVGSFRIFSKGSPSCRSSKYPLPRGGAPMPYCMKFHRAGYAIHGSPQIGPRNSSHGCVRVTTTAAKWLSQNAIRNGTKVIVLPYR